LQVGQRKRREVQGQISRKVGREINSFRDSKKRDIPPPSYMKEIFSRVDPDSDPADTIPVLNGDTHHITSLGAGAGMGAGAGAGRG
jgi:hypothetical protein